MKFFAATQSNRAKARFFISKGFENETINYIHTLWLTNQGGT